MARTSPISRRRFLQAAAAAAAGALAYTLYEPHELTVEPVDVRLTRLPSALDGFRLVQISDLHFGDFTYEDHLRRVVETVNAQKPDLVVITGDYVTAPLFGSRRKGAEAFAPGAQVLRELHAPHGALATLGNHDHSSDATVITSLLQNNGVTVLRNRAQAIERDGKRFWLAGGDDAVAKRFDLQRTLSGIPRDEAVVLAVHEPDLADYVQKYPVDLQISGHSHGGQVRFPLIGPIYLPQLAQKYPIGYRWVGPLQLYTNRGVGVIHLPVRFRCPPEITVLTLRSRLTK